MVICGGVARVMCTARGVVRYGRRAWNIAVNTSPIAMPLLTTLRNVVRLMGTVSVVVGAANTRARDTTSGDTKNRRMVA